MTFSSKEEQKLFLFSFCFKMILTKIPIPFCFANILETEFRPFSVSSKLNFVFFLFRNDSEQNFDSFFVSQNGLTRNFVCFLSVETKVFLLFVSQWFETNLKFLYFTEWFETEFRVFLLHQSQRNSDEMAVLFAWFRISQNTLQANLNLLYEEEKSTGKKSANIQRFSRSDLANRRHFELVILEAIKLRWNVLKAIRSSSTVIISFFSIIAM